MNTDSDALVNGKKANRELRQIRETGIQTESGSRISRGSRLKFFAPFVFLRGSSSGLVADAAASYPVFSQIHFADTVIPLPD